MARKKRKSPKQQFKQAIDNADHLQFQGGLNAVPKAEGKDRIQAEDTEKLLGSSNIDDDYLNAAPNANRWDFVIGYNRSGKVVAHFVEVHSANTGEVSKMKKKLNWLTQEFLRQENNAKLAALPREIHWVASGKFNILKDSPQYRYLKTQLRKKGLRGPVTQLILS